MSRLQLFFDTQALTVRRITFFIRKKNAALPMKIIRNSFRIAAVASQAAGMNRPAQEIHGDTEKK